MKQSNNSIDEYTWLRYREIDGYLSRLEQLLEARASSPPRLTERRKLSLEMAQQHVKVARAGLFDNAINPTAAVADHLATAKDVFIACIYGTDALTVTAISKLKKEFGRTGGHAKGEAYNATRVETLRLANQIRATWPTEPEYPKLSDTRLARKIETKLTADKAVSSRTIRKYLREARDKSGT